MTGSKIRVVTLEMAIQVLKYVVGHSLPPSPTTAPSTAPSAQPLPPQTSTDTTSPEEIQTSSSSEQCHDTEKKTIESETSDQPADSEVTEHPSSGASDTEPVDTKAKEGSEVETLLEVETVVSSPSAEKKKRRPVSGNRSWLLDHHLALLEGAREEATLVLRNFYKSEEMFLDLFEDEWTHSGCGATRSPQSETLRVEYLLQDSSMLLPPTATPLTGIHLNKRRPCGEVKKGII